MSYTNFHRQDHMTKDVHHKVMDAIRNELDDEITNMLYGLFDGYLYAELEKSHKELFDICNAYPKVTEADVVQSILF